MLSVKQRGIKYHFWVFGMTRPGTEPRSPGPLANTLTARPMSSFQNTRVNKKFCNISVCGKNSMLRQGQVGLKPWILRLYSKQIEANSTDSTQRVSDKLHHHHHHHVEPLARISLILSRHFSLSFITSGRSSGLHPVSSHCCWVYVRAGRPAFARPYVGLHRSTSLMSSSLLLQQCPACLVRLTWIVFVMGGRWEHCLFVSYSIRRDDWSTVLLAPRALLYTRLLRAILNKVSLASHNSVWFITFTNPAKAFEPTELCLTLPKYCRTFDSPQ